MATQSPGADLDPARLFAPLAARRGLVLAVSGGPDSTALMWLAARWAGKEGPHPPTVVATVDHGLRAEAAAEAEQVAANAARLGFDCAILRAGSRSPTGNLQDWARRERYRLLSGLARERGFDTVVTAHHRDDQAETVLLRLASGSNLYGLAAMPAFGCLDEVWREPIGIARPLLGVPKAALAALAAASALPVAHDPGNADRRFARGRLRAMASDLAAIGLTAERLNAAADGFRRAAEAIDAAADDLIESHAEVNAAGSIRLPLEPLLHAPAEVAGRALGRMVQGAGGGEFLPASASVDALLRAIGDGAARTLSGARVASAAGILTLRREWGRVGLPSAPGGTNFTPIWDRRFAIHSANLMPAVTVGALGNSHRRWRAPGFARAEAATLPALYSGGDIVALPPGATLTDAGPDLPRLEMGCIVFERLIGRRAQRSP